MALGPKDEIKHGRTGVMVQSYVTRHLVAMSHFMLEKSRTEGAVAGSDNVDRIVDACTIERATAAVQLATMRNVNLKAQPQSWRGYEAEKCGSGHVAPEFVHGP